jgi:hypothetical protein
MLDDVEPVLQFNVPLQPLARNIAVSVPQRVSLIVVIVGVIAVAPILIMIGVDDVLSPQIFLHVAV